MKALIKKYAKKGLWLEDVPKPRLGPNDVLIKVSKSAICGTDLHIYLWDNWAKSRIKLNQIIGHEYVGHIAALGSEVAGLKEGDRVTGEGHIACGRCRNCRRGRKHVCEKTIGIGVDTNGSFAEYVKIPAENVMKINAAIPDEIVAVMDPLGNATHTALSFPLIGEDVLITGAGLIGSMAVQVVRFAGARNIVVTEINAFRADLAKKMGATKVINPQKQSLENVMKTLKISGFDVGLECSGSPIALNDLVRNMYSSGKISLLGILPQNASIDWNKIIFSGLTLKGIYGREMFETWYQMEQMLLSGLDISPIITHRFSIDDFQAGFDIMEQGDCGKVILNWE